MIIRTDKLSVGYGKKVVVSDINIALLEGQFVCLLGPNGSGKSTILKTLVRMLQPLGGGVYLNGQNITGLSNREIARTTAVVLTDPIAAGLLTVYDIVMLGRHPHTGFMGKPMPEDDEKVLGALQMVNAADLTQRYFSELSDGEKQKVLLARALAQEPKLIVLDEPTSHLDARHRIEVMLILRQLTRGKGVTVIASLHDIDLAMKACDVAILIKGEQIIACGTPEDILHEDLVAEVYGMENATFSSKLGGVELRSRQQGSPVFVVAGGGAGAGIFRALGKQNVSVSTGLLTENDIDYHIARAIGIETLSVSPSDNIGDVIYREACIKIESAKQVIDSGFTIGQNNLKNAVLISYALEKGKPVLTFRDKESAGIIFRDKSRGLIYCNDYFELISAIRKGI